MPVWLGDRLYFRDAKGVEVWRNGEISTFLAGVQWPACLTAGTCQPREPGEATGKTYIYDLADHVESSSVITKVYDIWPHAA
jgi:hypothetical protein